MKILRIAASLPAGVRRFQTFARRNWILSSVVGLLGLASSVFGLLQPFMPSAGTNLANQTGSAAVAVDSRDSCEKLTARGLKCNPEGFLEALENNDRKAIDLFLAAGFGPTSTINGPLGGKSQIWSAAFYRDYSSLSYILEKRSKEKLESFDGCNTLKAYKCNPAIEIHNVRLGEDSTMDSETRCRIVRQAGGRQILTQMRKEQIENGGVDREAYAHRWKEAIKACGHGLPIGGYQNARFYCGSERYDIDLDTCVEELCQAGRASFRAEYPTEESYVSAKLKTSTGDEGVEEVFKEIERCT